MNPKLAKATDVARLAGVSPATVSRAFNAPNLLDEQTLQRVRNAAAKLDYRPQGLARSLRGRRSLVIGVLIPSLRNAYFAETVEQIQALLAARGYTVLIASSHYDADAEVAAVKAMASHGVDALLMVGRPMTPASRWRAGALGIPTLRAWIWPDEPPCIGFDHDAAMRDVARHLLQLGHRRFALVIPFVALRDEGRSRLSAIREALADAGVVLPSAAVVDDLGFGIAAGRNALQVLRQRGVEASAVICSNDQLAAGVILQARALGLDVPRDLSVTGYNDTELGATFEPPITTVSTPMADHATQVVEALLAMAAGASPAASAALPTSLVVRASTGPAPPASPR
jgi:LacI family transcriptional regulator